MGENRELALVGMYNVRDLGGLPIRTGGSTAHGGFVRSESPHGADADGWAALHGHGVRTCVDMRSSWEIARAPYEPMIDGVVRTPGPLEEGLLDEPAFQQLAESGQLSCALYFQPFLEHWPERVAATFRVLAAAGPGAVLYHCQRGRDRTGLVTILLLSLVDVEPESIVADHLRTDRLLVERGVALGHVPLDGEAEVYTAHGSNAVDTLRSLVHGFDAASYLRDAGLTERELAALRARLLPS